MAVITAVRTTSERKVDRQAVVVLVNEVRKAQAAVRNARHKQFEARLVHAQYALTLLQHQEVEEKVL